MLGKILLALLAVVAVLGVIGAWQKKQHPEENTGDELDKAMGNVVDLNDRFNRARQMDQDGK